MDRYGIAGFEFGLVGLTTYKYRVGNRADIVYVWDVGCCVQTSKSS
jgi:hypothetical protein